jgi:hypothetical protein
VRRAAAELFIDDMPNFLEFSSSKDEGKLLPFLQGLCSMQSIEFSSIRIDVPLNDLTLYFFVRESHSSWDPWWEALYSHLVSYAAPDMEWRLEPIQNVFCAERHLSQEETSQLLDMLKTAPQKEIDEHSTLRKSIKKLGNRERPASLMYFRDGTSAKREAEQ